jgi:hypothetical protein
MKIADARKGQIGRFREATRYWETNDGEAKLEKTSQSSGD